MVIPEQPNSVNFRESNDRPLLGSSIFNRPICFEISLVDELCWMDPHTMSIRSDCISALRQPVQMTLSMTASERIPPVGVKL
jgi:hypothetical protein